MDVEIVPCSIGHLEKLIEGADAFLNTYGLQVVDGYGHVLNMLFSCEKPAEIKGEVDSGSSSYDFRTLALSNL